MAAKIMEPSRGASTCAFGSQRCIKYIGVFTRKASSTMIGILNFSIIVDIIINDGLFLMKMILVRSGKDAMIVYIIKYTLASKRSGCFPFIIIRIIVGINTSSNII